MIPINEMNIYIYILEHHLRYFSYVKFCICYIPFGFISIVIIKVLV